MVDVDPTGARPFSTVVREHTMAWHQSAEDSGFLRRVATGETDQRDCVAMAVQHRAVYRCLDAGTEALRADPAVSAFTDHPGLARTPSIEADVRSLTGDEPATPTIVLPATQAYVARIAQAATTSYGLVAHHYTRYLGDLSGGFVIGNGFAACLGVDVGDPGTTFYRFDAIADPVAFKRTYRHALDNNAWDEAQQQAFLDEVIAAYEHNQAMYAELADLAESRSLVP